MELHPPPNQMCFDRWCSSPAWYHLELFWELDEQINTLVKDSVNPELVSFIILDSLENSKPKESLWGPRFIAGSADGTNCIVLGWSPLCASCEQKGA